MENKETTEVGGVELTKEDIDKIFCGVRPANMDYETFKKLRKEMKRGLKGYLKGKYFFISTALKPGEGNTEGLTRHTATYIKEK